MKTTPTTALFTPSHLEVSRTVLRAGKDVAPHDVVGEMTVQCLEGRVELAAAGNCAFIAFN